MSMYSWSSPKVIFYHDFYVSTTIAVSAIFCTELDGYTRDAYAYVNVRGAFDSYTPTRARVLRR